MKKLLTILLLATGFALQASEPIQPAPAADKMVKLTVKWSFKNIVDGYDHDTKTELYVDGRLLATSTVTKESKPNSVSADVTAGMHQIRVVNYAMYEGNWEVHSISNNYSIDCLYEESINCNKKKNTVVLEFDINSGTSRKK